MNERRSLTDKCIVLDLDETLISTQDDMEDIDRLGIMANSEMLEVRERLYILNLLDATGKRGQGEKSQMWGLERPGLQEFIEFCFLYFDKVIVWTAAYERYAIQLCRHIFRNSDHWPDLIYTRDDCATITKNGKDIRYKPLSKLYADPRLEGKVQPENTLALDNNIDTFLDNPRNAVHIPDFDPKQLTKDEVLTKNAVKRLDDAKLAEFQDWLLRSKVVNTRDVRTLDKTDIFSSDKAQDQMEQEPYQTYEQTLEIPMNVEAQA